MPIVIGTLIAIYAGFIIIKKVKEYKNGNFCGGGCSGCPSKSKCSQK